MSQVPGMNIQTDCSRVALYRFNDAYNQLPDQYKRDSDNLNNLQVLQKLLETAAEAQQKCTEVSMEFTMGG